MIVKDASFNDLLIALDETNKLFNDNIVIKKVKAVNQARTRWSITLGVLDSRAPGSRKGLSGRRIAACCWHAYGTFMDALPPYARFKSSHLNDWMMPGEEWQDWNIGSVWNPMMYSEACDCNKEADY